MTELLEPKDIVVIQTEWRDGMERGGLIVVLQDFNPKVSAVERVKGLIEEEVGKLDCGQLYDLTMGCGVNWGDGLGLLDPEDYERAQLHFLYCDSNVEWVDHDEVLIYPSDRCEEVD